MQTPGDTNSCTNQIVTRGKSSLNAEGAMNAYRIIPDFRY